MSMCLNYETNYVDENIKKELENVSRTTITELTLKSICFYVKYFKLKNFKLLESSGSSVVIVSDDIYFVLQIYNKIETYLKINYLILDLLTNPFINIKVSSRYHLCYDISEYLVLPIDFNKKRHSCFWEKIIPLNFYNQKDRNKLILDNKYKIIWDIAKALFGFHSKGYVHGDCTVDNIGIKDGKFILFDFDGSGPIQYNNEFVDYSKFFKSLYFHTEDIFFKDFYLEIEFNKGITLFRKILEETDIDDLETEHMLIM